MKALAKYLQNNKRFSSFLTDEMIELIFSSAPLHDIGKVGIPDSILLKPEKLTKAEFEVMKTHTTIGYQALCHAESMLGHNSFLNIACQIAHSHHERWDGSGYPQGLSGDDIPIPGRLMAIADVYDALINKRCYKEAFSHSDAVNIIKEGRGNHFDPDMVDAFIALECKFIDIATQLSDGSPIKLV